MNNQLPNSTKPTIKSDVQSEKPNAGNPLTNNKEQNQEVPNPTLAGMPPSSFLSSNSADELPNNTSFEAIYKNGLNNFFSTTISAKATRKEKALFQMFLHHFESLTRYIDHDFNLKVAAREIGTNEKYLSSAINNCSGMSFNKIVNHYRITNAQKLINDDVLTRLNLEEIAYMSGFGNRTTFYRVFTEMLGITPSRYRDNLNRGVTM